MAPGAQRGEGLRVHVGPASALLGTDERVVVEAAGREILVLAVRGTVYAVGNRCTHLPAQLRRGQVLPGTLEITCNIHMGRYSLVTGEATEPPCEIPLPKYTVEITDGQVYVLLPSASHEPPRELHSRSAGGGRPAEPSQR